jgi:hypothetical protein
MILDDIKQDVTVNGNFKTSGFKIQATAKAFDILSSNIYTHKVRAVVREISCNARDAHVAAGNNEPFDVHLPTPLEPWFTVRDYGTGLSDEEVREIFSTYFCSTKTGSNEFIGALGLGSKSPFCLVDSFMVTSYLDGIQRTYSCYRDEHGEPQVASLTKDETNEPNGLEVSLSIDGKCEEFREEAIEVYNYFEELPNINDKSVETEIQVNKNKFIFQDEDFAFGVGYGDTKAVMGGVAYKIPDQYDVFGLEGYIKFELGEISFDAGRESLSLDDKTIKAIKEKSSKVKEQLYEKAREKVLELDTPFKRASYAQTLLSGRLASFIKTKLREEFSLPEIDNIVYYGRSYGSPIKGETKRLPLGSEVRYYHEQPRFTTRIKAFLKDQRTVKTIVLLTPPQIKFSLIDIDQVRDLDELPKVERRYGSNSGSTVKTFKFTGNARWHDNRSSWASTEVEITNEERIYVPIKRWKPDEDLLSHYIQSNRQIENVTSTLDSVGIDIDIIYGLKTSFTETKAFKNGNWIKLDDFIRREVTKRAPKKVLSYDCQNRDLLLHLYEKGITELEDWKNLYDQYKNQGKIAMMCERLNIAQEKDLSLEDLDEAFIKKYPMLQFVDRWEVSNNSETITNYIKGVCND